MEIPALSNDWAVVLQDAFNRKADVIPPGWKTVKEIAKEQRVSKEHVSRIVTKLVKSGKLEMKKFRSEVSGVNNGNVRRRSYFRLHPYYRIIKNPNQKKFKACP
jgi:DNA-binding Lrp family transcriptional regulator